jgi:hypothetical protein
LTKNRAKTIQHTKGPHPHSRHGQAHPKSRPTKNKLKTQLRQDKMAIHHRRREDAMTAMRGADVRRSNVDEEVNPLRSCAKETPAISIKGKLVVRTTQSQCPQHRQDSGAAAPTSSCSTTSSEPQTPPFGAAIPKYHSSHASHDAKCLSYPQPKLHRANRS